MTKSDRPPGTATQERPARANARLVAAMLLTALVTLFAVLNLERVEVNWLVGTRSTPLIVVIVLSAVLGALADRIVQRRARG